MFVRALVTTFAAVTLSLRIANQSDAQTYSGKVTRVTDGDTFSVATDNGMTVRIRLSDIDAPENGQAYGKAAKKVLRGLVQGRRITARVNDIDRYGRPVARINRAGLDVNAEMVRRGAAWAYTRYQTDGRFAMWQRETRSARRGLWNAGSGAPVPPWEWRAAKRGVNAVSTTAQAARLQAGVGIGRLQRIVDDDDVTDAPRQCPSGRGRKAKTLARRLEVMFCQPFWMASPTSSPARW